MKWNLKNKHFWLKSISEKLLNPTSPDTQKSSNMDHRPECERQIVKLLEDKIKLSSLTKNRQKFL